MIGLIWASLLFVSWGGSAPAAPSDPTHEQTSDTR